MYKLVYQYESKGQMRCVIDEPIVEEQQQSGRTPTHAIEG